MEISRRLCSTHYRISKKRAVTADTALRLARYFGISEEFWMGLQADYELKKARKKLGKRQ